MCLLHSFVSGLTLDCPLPSVPARAFLEESQEEMDGEEGRPRSGKARVVQGAAAGGADRAAGIGQACAHSQGVCAARGGTWLLGLSLHLLGTGKSSFFPGNVPLGDCKNVPVVKMNIFI